MFCPTCRNEFDEPRSTAMPFCSERCQQIDLGRWLNEEQAIPNWTIPDEGEEEEPYDPDA